MNTLRVGDAVHIKATGEVGRVSFVMPGTGRRIYVVTGAGERANGDWHAEDELRQVGLFFRLWQRTKRGVRWQP
jgi:hypothetical protein